MGKEILLILEDIENEAFISRFSLLEIAIKQRIGKLPDLQISHTDIVQNIKLSEFTIMPIKDRHIETYQQIPFMAEHRDPFDRFLLATSFSEKIRIITSDEKFIHYVPMVEVIFVS